MRNIILFFFFISHGCYAQVISLDSNSCYKTKGVIFDIHTFEIRPESFTILDSIKKKLLKDSNINVNIVVFVDTNYPVKMSINSGLVKAQKIAFFLKKNGITKQRISYNENKSKNMISKNGERYVLFCFFYRTIPSSRPRLQKWR